jgi:ABC-type oligopeptide transport system substrate-binding subunit
MTLAMLAAGCALLAAGALATRGARGVRDGGTFRILEAGVDYIDPALSFQAISLLQATCLTPAQAAPPPKVSKDGLTYTYTIRKGQRFNNGERVTAVSFAHELARVLSPEVQSGAAQYYENIAGAREFESGKAKSVSGLVARGRTLVIRLAQPTPDLPARLGMTFACAVPAGLPFVPDGVSAPLPAAGPYFIARYVPGHLILLERNRRYHGRRPHHVDEFRATFVDSSATGVARVARGQADWVDEQSSQVYAGVRKRFKLGPHQLFVRPALATWLLVMNTSRGVFKENVPLRRAVNYAIDRPALIRQGQLTARPTDQYLPPAMPGFRNARLYPLRRPNLRRAGALARGHTRNRVAVLYTTDVPARVAQAQVVKTDLARIGLRVDVKPFPGPNFFQRLFLNPSEPFDLAILGSGADYPDPYAMLNVLFEGKFAKGDFLSNFSRFDSRKWNGLLERAARRRGAARYRAYGRLDVRLARDAAPAAAYANDELFTLVSRRTGCVHVHPGLDLGAVCLRR